MIDPATGLAIVQTGAEIAGMIFGGEDPINMSGAPQGIQQSDLFSRLKNILSPETSAEQQLASLQQGLFRSGAQAFAGGIPGELSLGSLARGELSPAAMQRIQEASTAGLRFGLEEASRVAGEQALARGIPLSGIEAIQTAQLQRPLIAQSMQLRAGLEQQELGRLQGLRGQALSNMMALQNSPALQRLLQIRMQEATRENLQLTRKPGGLPEEITGIKQDSGNIIQRINSELHDYNAYLMSQGTPKYRRNRMVNDKRKALAAEYGFIVTDDYRIVDPNMASASDYQSKTQQYDASGRRVG